MRGLHDKRHLLANLRICGSENFVFSVGWLRRLFPQRTPKLWLFKQYLNKRLASEDGFSGSALKWFESYFTSRSQAVVVNDVSSASHFPKEGIPQGSVLEPFCFSMYTAPLEKIIENYVVERMIYADDTQVYAVLTESDREAVIDKS